MKKIQVLFFALLICLFAANLYAQEQGKISGTGLLSRRCRNHRSAGSRLFSLCCCRIHGSTYAIAKPKNPPRLLAYQRR